ncbi:MAG: HlyD family efflux transporter periplasmic adaptor subunit, partial [Verrucomicrobiota bacterium]
KKSPNKAMAEKENPKPKAERGEKAPEKKDAEIETHVVKKGPIEVTEKISGVLQSQKSSPMALNLLRWTDLLVIDCLPHGSEVKKGDVIVELETKAILKRIDELELGMPLKFLELETAKWNLEKLKKSTPMSLEKARESKARTEEDFAYFEDVTRPMREKNAVHDVKQIKDYLTYAEEELNQLKKMYEADDLTEETEEIILRRAENSVNDYRWRLEQTEERSRRTLNTLIPREQEGLERNLVESQLSWRASEKSIPAALKKAELEFKAKARALDDAETSLAEHIEDFEAMTVRAPHDGIVYYGMTQRGKWTTASTVERKLVPGGKLSMREIFMTVVDPKKQDLLLSIPENKLSFLDAGQGAEVKLTSNPDEAINGKVTSVSHVPYSDNTFAGVIQLSGIGGDLTLFPGMKAEAEITIYSKDQALLVPEKAVKEEDEESYITLKGGVTRKIETGRTADGTIEVLKGLKVGDEILLSPSAGEKDAESKEEKK